MSNNKNKNVVYKAEQLPIDLQALGEKMTREHGFLGVPEYSFEESGRNQLITLLEEGITPDSKVLEIGCGVLRVGYWLIHFLNKDSYYGIEPAKNRVELGKEYLLYSEILESKKPHFDYNSVFDTSVFNTKFDFFLAGSIWTHCSKESIKVMLDGFVNNTNESAVFLTSYLPARSKKNDYQGNNWVGTSHKSDVSGCIKHSRKWIQFECEKRGLVLEKLSRNAFDNQYWLRISKHKKSKTSLRIKRAQLKRIINRILNFMFG